MPSSHWGIGFAFGLVVALSLSLFWVVALSPTTGQIIQAERDGSHQAEQSEESGPQQPNLLPILEPYGVIVTPADTLAQWIMAALGLIATGLSGWAVILLRHTLNETKVAARTAQDAVAVTREMGQLQIRAYVTIAEVRLANIKADQPPRLIMVIKNTGLTPANKLGIVTVTTKTNEPKTIRASFDGMRPESNGELGAGLTIYHGYPLDEPLSEHEFTMLRIGQIRFVVFGAVVYRDIFNRQRRMIFRYHSDRLEPGADHLVFNPTKRNNRSN